MPFKNKKDKKKYMKEYYNNNKEKLKKQAREYSQEYYPKNKEKRLNKCLICDKPKWKRSTKCKECYYKERGSGKYIGIRSPNWKGDEVGYKGLHDWIKKNKPKPKLCECCGKEKKLELANISQKYLRDINDYEWICRKCHQEKDGRIKNRDNKGRFKKGDKNVKTK